MADDGEGFTITEPEDPAPQSSGGPAPKARRRDLSSLVLSDIDMIRGDDGNAYALCPMGRGRRELMLIGSRGFDLYLRGVALDRHGVVIGKQALQDAVDIAEHRARNAKEMHRVWRRVAEGDDGAIYLDLGGADPHGERRAVRIARDGWGLRQPSDVPVHFIRASDALPLPEPEAGSAAWGDLGEIVNGETDDDILLAWIFLICALRPHRARGGYPPIILTGPAGSGKSTATIYLHLLFDPSSVTLLNLSNDPRDYPPILASRHGVSFDNLSSCSDVISDLMARTATSAVWAGRRLNTNGELFAVRMLNPLLLNGIPETLGRLDLQERSLMVRLVRIVARRTDSEIAGRFDQLWPRLLGLLCDGISSALRRLGDTPVPDGLRMADAAQWAEAAAEGLGVEPGRLAAAWRTNRHAMQRAALDVDEVARALVAFLEKRRQDTGSAEWKGEPTELYRQLCDIAGERVTRARSWPSRAAGMATHFRRIGDAMRDVHGIEILSGKGGRDSTRWWSVRRV